MHIKERPDTMQEAPVYSDVIVEVKDFLKNASKKALDIGIETGAIVLDPGIGFGKTQEHNVLLLKKIEALKTLGFPVLLGVSRKSFIGKILNNAPAKERLAGTLAALAWGISKGINIHRVHNVKPAKDLALVLAAIMNAETT
jgi:dihydropteroate synthase